MPTRRSRRGRCHTRWLADKTHTRWPRSTVKRTHVGRRLAGHEEEDPKYFVGDPQTRRSRSGRWKTPCRRPTVWFVVWLNKGEREAFLFRHEFRQLNNELDLVEISYLVNGNSFQNRGRMGRREQTEVFLVWREKRKTFRLFWQLCNRRADVYYYAGVLFSLAKWSNWMFLTGHKFSPLINI